MKPPIQKDQRQNAKTDHDLLFKTLLKTYCPEFISLFFPALFNLINWKSLTPLDKELMRRKIREAPLSESRLAGTRQIPDLAFRVSSKNNRTKLIIHLEPQAHARNAKEFPFRMFKYFSRLSEEYQLPVLPIAILSFEKPTTQQANRHEVSLMNRKVLTFRYDVVQLNRLDWRKYSKKLSPVSAALMAKMNIASGEQPLVKLECIKMLYKLQLDAEKTEQIAQFIHTYLDFRRNIRYRTEFERLLDELELAGMREVKKMVTSWKIEGREENMLNVVTKLLERRPGNIGNTLQSRVNHLSFKQLEALALALLDFTEKADLEEWLRLNAPNE